MPVPKRYFHVSQELNHDPEVWAFTDKFGDRSIRTWLQILAILDRSENQWRVTESSYNTLGRMVRQYPKTVKKQVEQMIQDEWLIILDSGKNGGRTTEEPEKNCRRTVEEPEKNHSSTILEPEKNSSWMILSARNWMKYNRTQEHKRIDTSSRDAPLRSVPTPFLPVPSQDIPTVPPRGVTVNGSFWKMGEEAITFLNERTGKHFQSRHPNGTPTKALIAVESLLRKGYTTINIRQVIANRCLKWRDDAKMQEFLRPETLFRVSNFSNYIGELGKGVHHDSMP